MDIKNGKEYLTEKDFIEHSIWIMHQSDDLYYPVLGPDDLPHDMRLDDLRIRAIFTTKNEKIFNGYLVGLKNIFSIGIFLANRKFYFNKNLLDECIKSIEEINLNLPAPIRKEDFFPLRYQTNIDIEAFKNIEGEFNIFKPMTDEERLS